MKILAYTLGTIFGLLAAITLFCIFMSMQESSDGIYERTAWVGVSIFTALMAFIVVFCIFVVGL